MISPRYTFFWVFALLVSGLYWWSSSNPSVPPAFDPVISEGDTASGVSDSQIEARRDLLEVLDRLVVHEKYYHAVYGHFTKVLSRIDFTIPHSVASEYEVRVTEATQTRLLVTAFSEEGGRTADLASVDQSFHVQANFSLPSPRADDLRVQAQKHLRQMLDASSGQDVAEEGIFTHYFQYDLRPDSNRHPVAFAVGIKAPVLGVQFQLGPSDTQGSLMTEEGEFPLTNNPAPWVGESTGQISEGTVVTAPDDEFLAQRIFRGEMGRYAKDWSELSRITHFQGESAGAGATTNRSVATESATSARRFGSVAPLIVEPLE